MTLLAIDPGPEQSGWAEVVVWTDREPSVSAGVDDNREVLARARETHCPRLVVERPVGYGRPAGLAIMDTALWAGRFLQTFIDNPRPVTVPTVRSWELLSFADVALALCGTRGGVKEANAWSETVDLWGGPTRLRGVRCQLCKGKGWKGRGRPKCIPCDGSGWERPPGPLHGVTSHGRSAVALATASLMLHGHTFETHSLRG